jgi:DNA polymerase-3 subunit delta
VDGRSAGGRRLDETSVRPAYLLYGEDGYRAREFVRGLRDALPGPDGRPATLKTFFLEDARWREILDEARTIPFFFSPWQVLVAEGSGARDAELEDSEKVLLKEYFRSPTPKTVLVVLFEGKIPKNKALYRFFDGLPDSAAEAIEFAPLKGTGLAAWVGERLRASGKSATRGAVDLLLEAAGNDAGRLENEVAKLAVFVGDKPRIEESDVALLTTGIRDFEPWALSDSLDQMDLHECFRVIRKLFLEESVEAAELMLLGQLAAYFRDIVAAQSMLREGKDRREIFRDVRPAVPESWRDLYDKKFAGLFGAADALNPEDLARIIRRLSEIDLMKKTTESSVRSMLEALIVEYADIRRRGRVMPSGRR